jgi:hypothetical protein|tara:strand:- start:325 stop:546 length:222 start_codon:yes stop_codon:yes gene_type:complete
MDIRSLIVKALRKKYEADIEQAKTTVNIYLERPVGIGEHPQHLEEVDKLLSVIVDAEDKMRALNNHFDDDIPF